jgi:hypothetical protein
LAIAAPDQLNEPFALDQCRPGHRTLGLGDLLVDSALRAPRARSAAYW